MSDAAEGIPAAAELVSVGKYQLAFKLAAGGMATVYLARADGPKGFEKLVALKRIHPHLAAQQEYIDMFLDEARIASRITHANVCSVFDFGEADGEYFIAMEYLVGEPLSRVLRLLLTDSENYASARHPRFAARVIADACEGLHAAHELRDTRGELLNVVHRDVSPQNIFLTFDGNIRVVDFGVARARDKIHHTRTGEVKGKFPYMAPEQITCEEDMDRRADVWALGVMLWEMLTLRRLFRRDTPSKSMYAVLEADVLPPSQVRNGVPTELDAIVLKALSRNLDERYATARELGRDLLTYLSNTGDPFGPADVADLMTELFPEGEGRARQLMDVARLPRQAVPELPAEEKHTDALADSSREVSSVRRPTSVTNVLEGKPRRTKGALLGAAALALAIVSTGLAVGLSSDPEALTEESEPALEIPAAEAANPEPTPTPVAVAEPEPQAPTPTGEPIEPAAEVLEDEPRSTSRMRRGLAMGAARMREVVTQPANTPEPTPGRQPSQIHGSPIAQEVPF